MHSAHLHVLRGFPFLQFLCCVTLPSVSCITTTWVQICDHTIYSPSSIKSAAKSASPNIHGIRPEVEFESVQCPATSSSRIHILHLIVFFICFSLFVRESRPSFCVQSTGWQLINSPSIYKKSSLDSIASRSASKTSATPPSHCKESLLASPKVEGTPPASKLPTLWWREV